MMKCHSGAVFAKNRSLKQEIETDMKRKRSAKREFWKQILTSKFNSSSIIMLN